MTKQYNRLIMKRKFYILFFLAGFAINIYSQDENDSAFQLYVDGDLPAAEDRNGKLKNTMRENAIILLTAVQNAIQSGTEPRLDKRVIVEEGMRDLLDLWKHKSQFYCKSSEVYSTLLKYSDNVVNKNECAYELRDIGVNVQNAEEEIPQTLNILFNRQGKICGLTFGIDTNFIRNITDGSQGDSTDLVRKKIVMHFLEDFRMAYTRKDIAYLEKVYSEDALIIVGRTLQKVKNSGGDNGGMSVQTVQYIKKTKQEYLSSLASVFKSSESIDVDFENVKVDKHPNKSVLYEDMYCVNLDQIWTSQKKSGADYHDEGYLFLMINFSDQNRPQIQVRTWQNMNNTERKDRITVFNLNNYR